MYGDDTWIKLLPNVFHRSEGTTSFFVSVCASGEMVDMAITKAQPVVLGIIKNKDLEANLGILGGCIGLCGGGQ